MSEHKIQSREGDGLDLHLAQVPKALGCIAHEWAEGTADEKSFLHPFVVSFKLETDAAILDGKVASSFDKYGVKAVIGNLLQSYKTEAILYHRVEGRPQLLKEVFRATPDAGMEDSLVMAVLAASSPRSSQNRHRCFCFIRSRLLNCSTN